jgi:hypothetical protein
MPNQAIYQNASGGWTLVDVPDDGPDGHFYTRPHSLDRHFRTREQAWKALLALRPQPDDDAT